MNRFDKFLAATFLSAAMFCARPAFGQSCGLHDSPIDCAQKELRRARQSESLCGSRQREGRTQSSDCCGARAILGDLSGQARSGRRAREVCRFAAREGHVLPESGSVSAGHGPQSASGTGAIADLLDRSVGGAPIDGGIPQSAKPEFSDWTQAFFKNLGAAGGLFTTQASANVNKALAASQPQYDRYILERDWAEFDALNRVPVGYEAPRNYAAMLYFRFGKLPLETAFDTVASMVKLLGADAVDSAAQQVKAARKNTTRTAWWPRKPVKIGPGGNKLPDDTIPAAPNVIGSFGGSLSAFEALATRGDDRRYLLKLIAENSNMQRNQSRYIGEWDRAATWYNRYVFAFGEPEVIEVSHQVRVAVKRMIDGWVMHPEAIGSTRMTPYPRLRMSSHERIRAARTDTKVG